MALILANGKWAEEPTLLLAGMSGTVRKREDRSPSPFSGWIGGQGHGLQGQKGGDSEGSQHDRREGHLLTRNTVCFSKQTLTLSAKLRYAWRT